MEQILGAFDSSFKYILLGFNFITLFAVYLHKRSRKTKKEHHLLFITAHPDDEAMFFGPTIASLNSDYFIHILCLSGGGTEREKELEQSAQYLGIHKFQCISDPKLQDGMKEKWCEQTILELVKKYINENHIKALFTFDNYGVSGHLNHQAIYNSLSSFETTKTISPPPVEKKQQNQAANKSEEESKDESKEENSPAKEEKILKIYYLQSANIIRKYTGCLEILIALVRDFSWMRLNYISAWKAMQFHASQFTWYRKLWVIFSRYTYINTYRLRRVCFE